MNLMTIFNLKCFFTAREDDKNNWHTYIYTLFSCLHCGYFYRVIKPELHTHHSVGQLENSQC